MGGAMTKLSSRQLDVVQRFIFERGRQPDAARLAHALGEQAPEAVARALRPYRNSDGGFGHGLEPDYRSPSSSPLATAIALRALADVGSGADHPWVRGALTYLRSTFDDTRRRWTPTPADVNAHPHAPWWHDAGEPFHELHEHFRVMPRAEIVALLYRFGMNATEPEWLDALAQETVADFERIPPERLTGHTLYHAREMAMEPTVPAALRERLIAHYLPHLGDRVAWDETSWDGYVMQPALAVPSPDAPGHAHCRVGIDRNLDWWIERLRPEGYWEPNWHWQGEYPETWEAIRDEVRSAITWERLQILKRYGRWS